MIRHEVIIRVKPDLNREVIDRTLRESYDLLIELPGVDHSFIGATPEAKPYSRQAMATAKNAAQIRRSLGVQDEKFTGSSSTG